MERRHQEDRDQDQLERVLINPARPTMGRKVRFAPQAARKSDIPDGPLRAQFRTHAPQQRTPYSLGSDDRYGVKDARTATIEPNEIDNMPLRARWVRTPRPASPRDAAPPSRPSAPCRRPPACFAPPACAATPAR